VSSPIPAELSAHLESLPARRDVRLASLTDWAFVRLLDAAIDHVGVENIVATVDLAYDTYIVPLDIPIVEGESEAAFDRTAKLMLGLTIRGFHSLIHAPQPAERMMGAAPRIWIGAAA
jgi:hypothetical protein